MGTGDTQQGAAGNQIGRKHTRAGSTTTADTQKKVISNLKQEIITQSPGQRVTQREDYDIRLSPFQIIHVA